MNQTRMEEVKKVAKRIKKAYVGELTLSQVHHALSRALGFVHLHELQKCLAVPSASQFWAMVEMLVPIPDDLTFQAAVARFAQSSGITTEAANSMCIQHLLPMLEKWKRIQADSDSRPEGRPHPHENSVSGAHGGDTSGNVRETDFDSSDTASDKPREVTARTPQVSFRRRRRLEVPTLKQDQSPS